MSKLFNLFKIFFISFFIVSFTMINYNSQRADAVVGVDDVVAVEGGTIATAAVATAVGFALVAGGSYIAENFDSTDIQYIATGMIQSGEASKAFAVKALATGQQVLTWTADGWNWLCDEVSNMQSSGTFSGSFSDTTVTVSELSNASGNVIDGPSFNIPANSTMTFNKTDGSVISGVSTYTFTSAISNVHWHWYIGSSNTVALQLINTAISVYSWDTASQYTKGIVNFQIVDNLGNSVCPDVPISDGISNWNENTASDVIGSSSTSSDGSIDYQPKVGIPLTGQDVVGSDGSSSTVYSPSVDVPYGDSWSNTGSIAIPTTATGTGTGTATGTGTGTATDSLTKEDVTDSVTDGIDNTLNVPDSVPTLDFSPLQVATEKFPFSIPWTIWDCYKVFDADSQAFDYKFDEIDVNLTSVGMGSMTVIPSFELNFSNYPQVGEGIQVFKYLELIAFIVFLAIKTRSIIRG